MKSICSGLAVMVLLSNGAFAAEGVSIYQVIGDPARFNDKDVVISGVLGVSDNQSVALYANSESKSEGVTLNAILLSGGYGEHAIGPVSEADVKALDGKYVTVWGTYHYDKPRDRLYTGAIGGVTALKKFWKVPATSIPAPD